MKLDLGQAHQSAVVSGEGSKQPTPADGVPVERRPFLERAGDEVAAWFGDADASSRRQRDEAIGDHSGKGPAGDSASDARLLAAVSDRLTEDSRLDATGIRVTVISGSVALHGSVITAADRDLAEEDARAAGSGYVTNNLMVG